MGEQSPDLPQVTKREMREALLMFYGAADDPPGYVTQVLCLRMLSASGMCEKGTRLVDKISFNSYGSDGEEKWSCSDKNSFPSY